MNALLRESQEEEFDIDDVIVLPKKEKPQQGEGGGGGGGGEGDEDEFEPDDAESELDRQQGDDHSDHGEAGDKGDEEEGVDSKGNAVEESDVEEHSKRVSSKAAKKQEEADAEGGDKGGPGKSGGSGGRGAGGRDNPRTVNWQGIKPRYDWKTLLARLVRSSNTMETTYQKVHRRNITSVHVASQTGAGVIRPGEKEVESNLVKLCIVVDSSGSMSSAITTVLANVQKLLTENSAAVSKSFAFVEFSSNYQMYLCTINGKSGTAREIKDIAEIKSGVGGGKVDTIANILSRHQGGATNFTEALVSDLSKFAAAKYNVLILTDTDIMGSGNKEAFLDLYAKHHQQVYLILDSRQSFLSVVQAMKSASANITHM